MSLSYPLTQLLSCPSGSSLSQQLYDVDAGVIGATFTLSYETAGKRTVDGISYRREKKNRSIFYEECRKDVFTEDAALRI